MLPLPSFNKTLEDMVPEGLVYTPPHPGIPNQKSGPISTFHCIILLQNLYTYPKHCNLNKNSIKVNLLSIPSKAIYVIWNPRS